MFKSILHCFIISVSKNQTLCSYTTPESGLNIGDPNVKLILLIHFLLCFNRTMFALLYESINVCVNLLTSQVPRWSGRICASIAIITAFIFVHHVHTCSFPSP